MEVLVLLLLGYILLLAERQHPLLGVRILARSYGSGVMTAQCRRVRLRGILEPDLTEDTHLSTSINLLSAFGAYMLST
jgi:hypothetical protein